ncbi:MAG: excinuclease ABC subunit UvrB [Lentimicrobium sp.]|jgi:excinuclease ABC subunit B|nr:excinuclease ABC subunit UvrB [Lentimicrobium sp.]MDD2526809.1 excinuclease ABC subunit UvrB [Lentimicrobiaceae bacterium]MDD4597892.1 excinuclease ABC subunit UvrB [Lentimicrobiaceae bacterium]MDY0024422.1 excinuclease ABC subunit UvrB [Lentimicrobium sp.]
MDFKLISDFQPTGDQPEAIQQLEEGLRRGDPAQVLLGVTGSGKTFTIANVIARVNRPTLILSHNKTLAAQLYGEFKQFFPENAVEYFVSYYDYYQPEAFIPTTNTYIEKDLSINEEIEKLRLSTTSSLLSGRRDIIVVSSVSCIYGIGNPADFANSVIHLQRGDKVARNKLLWSFVEGLYSRTEADFTRGNFRVKGDTVDIFPAYSDFAVRLIFWDDELETIETIHPIDGHVIEKLESINIYPANIFVTSKDKMKSALDEIQDDMVQQTEYFKQLDRPMEAKRLEDRVSYDIEMMRELGYCSGIENYSRYFDGRAVGSRPFCLLDYFPDDFLTVIDESHVTVSQIRAMYGGDRSRKQTLVEYGFRLPSAMDNRPLKFDEFENLTGQTIYVSATPADFELQQSEGVVVEQLIRPTGLIDPPVEVRPAGNQVDDLLEEISKTVKNGGRTLVTTLTKRMAEELTKYLTRLDINSRYIHSDVDTLERVEILRDLRMGAFDVLVGVNLLREGLDLPEVSLVAILDADKEGFLRSERSLTQTAGRAARNINSKVIMYADKITDSMRRAIDETDRRREKQVAYNEKHNITPKQIVKSLHAIMGQTSVVDQVTGQKAYIGPDHLSLAADPVVKYMNKDQLQKSINQTRKAMEKAAKELNFIEAARLRDEMFALQELFKNEA